jgi:hypothetical protein
MRFWFHCWLPHSQEQQKPLKTFRKFEKAFLSEIFLDSAICRKGFVKNIELEIMEVFGTGIGEIMD